jgi:hypothetical protein
VANAAALSESSINTIALAAWIRFAAKHAIARSVATAQLPRSSAFTVSMSLKIDVGNSVAGTAAE